MTSEPLNRPIPATYPERKSMTTETPTKVPEVYAGMKVRILGDTDPEQTYTVSEVNPVGTTGKQFRCALICDRTGQMKTGIAPSRLAPPYASKGPKSYQIGGFLFRPEVSEPVEGVHPAMVLAGLIKAPLAAQLLDLVVAAAEKDTQKAHLSVVTFCALNAPLVAPSEGPRTILDRLKLAFSTFPAPDYRPTYYGMIASLHARLSNKDGE